LRTKDCDRALVFNSYRHGDPVSLVRDDCPRILIKVHRNSI
jgi:hypothetical protein